MKVTIYKGRTTQKVDIEIADFDPLFCGECKYAHDINLCNFFDDTELYQIPGLGFMRCYDCIRNEI